MLSATLSHVQRRQIRRQWMTFTSDHTHTIILGNGNQLRAKHGFKPRFMLLLKVFVLNAAVASRLSTANLRASRLSFQDLDWREHFVDTSGRVSSFVSLFIVSHSL